MKTKELVNISLLFTFLLLPVIALPAKSIWNNVKFKNAEEFSMDFKKKHGRKPDEFTIFYNFHFAKAKETHRKAKYQEVIDYLPTLRESNQRLKNKIKRQYGLIIDYLEIDTLKSMGAIKKAADLQRILREKERKIPNKMDKEKYKVLKISIQMQLGNNHRSRGDFNAASEQTAKSQRTITDTLKSLNKPCSGCDFDGPDDASAKIFKDMINSVIASDKSQAGNPGEAESILETSHKEFEKKVAPVIYGQDKSSKHDSSWVLASIVKVRVLIDSGRTKEAVVLIDKVLDHRKNKSNDSLAADFRALRLEVTNQNTKAIQALKKLVESSPTNLLYLERLSNLYIKVGDYDKAKDVINNQLVIAEKQLGSGSLGAINSRIQAAWVSALEGKIEQSALSLKQSITNLESKLGTVNPTYIDAKLKHLILLFKMKKNQDVLSVVSDLEKSLYQFFVKEFRWKDKDNEKDRTALLGKYWQFIDLLFSMCIHIDNPAIEKKLKYKLLIWKNITLEDQNTFSEYFDTQIKNRFEQDFANQLGNKVLIEYKKYRPYNFNTFTFEAVSYGACIFSKIDNPNSCMRLDSTVYIDNILKETKYENPKAEVEKRILSSKKIKNKLTKLYDILIGKLIKRIAGVDEIIISPDGALNLLSFSSLLNTDGKYLIETHLLHYALAGRHIVNKKQLVKEKTYDYLGIGGIDFGEGNRYKELISTSLEINKINYFFTKTKTKTKILEQKQAKKEIVTRFMETAKFIHFATHASFIPNDSIIRNYSSWAQIALSNSNINESNSLNGNEIQALDLNGTSLVALSACDTGKGEITLSDGIYGLVRSFYIIGAENTLVSLWLVNDDEGYRFMVDLFVNIVKNPEESYAKAIRKTQLQLINEDRNVIKTDNWARFVLFEHK